MTFRQDYHQIASALCPDCGMPCDKVDAIDRYNATVNDGWGTTETNLTYKAMIDARVLCKKRQQLAKIIEQVETLKSELGC